MNKVTTINLNGNAYQLEEDGYEALRAYLGSAARNLGGNPDKDEIMADIEQAIADKFRALLGANKTVVGSKEVEKIVAEMGPVQDATEAGPGTSSAGPEAGEPGAAERRARGDGAGTPKRLYRIKEGAKIAGVCNGLAAYFNVDVSIIRILFVVLTVTWGFGLLTYVVMMFVVPVATTPDEKTAAFGMPSTAEEFIRRAKEGYYKGIRAFKEETADKWTHREWRRRFKQERRAWKMAAERRAWEMASGRGWQEKANPGRQNWSQGWAGHPGFSLGMAVAAPLIALFNAAITLLTFYAVYSLLVHGSAFGMHLPAGIPLWAGIIGLLMLCSLVTLPFKALRHAYRFHGGWAWSGCYGVWDSFIWMGILLVGIWYITRHVPQANEAMRQVFAALHQALDSIRQAWNKR